MTGGDEPIPCVLHVPPIRWRLREPYLIVPGLEDLVLLDHPHSLVGQAVLQHLLGLLGAQDLWVAQPGQERGQEVDFLLNLLLALLLGAYLRVRCAERFNSPRILTTKNCGEDVVVLFFV